ncbi:ABC transporter substrate-binding protein [Nakamurella endophytica]|uniref:Sugar ABC transporter substrate-binding protein n=1 Tax=Nakamurella endophytica TaxID=1748367 RepID=A0A917TAT5_9ACTN|nr:sugar ABC transporter substrate-binding protein [Nakamurella endophytica]GGM13853.1 hypothetical protein GCM10011594_37170 [Nakamurella endophytica]
MRIPSSTAAVALLGGIALVLTACGSGNSGSSIFTSSGSSGAAGTSSSATGSSTGGAASGGSAAATSEASSSSGSGGSGGAPVTLTFESLAFQPPTVAAVKKIVADWNSSHPDIQVTLQQGSADSAGDQYTTQLQGGTAPDIMDFQASLITDYIKQGYLADISQYIDPQVKASIPQAIWDTVTVDGKVYAEPTLLQSYVVFANTDQFKAAGVPVPTGKSLSWDDFQALAAKLTTGGHAGLGWGLKSPAATVLNLSLGFDGTFFSGDPNSPSFDVGANELQVPQRIKKMITDKNLDATSVTQGGSDTLPGFFAGKYAMVVGGDYIAQTIKNSGPADLHWTVLPPLAGSSSAHQGADPQTLSVTQQSQHQKEAAEFINYFLSAKNLAAVGQGDWLIPSSQAARDEILAQTKGADGWTNILATATELVPAPFQTANGYPKWKTQTMIPSLQKYFAGSLDDQGLVDALKQGWSAVG